MAPPGPRECTVFLHWEPLDQVGSNLEGVSIKEEKRKDKPQQSFRDL
jgi:hypothetical protein